MNKGLVDLAELRKRKNQADYEGKSSYCFKVGNKVLKIYARKEDKGFFIPLDTSKISDFSMFSADTIAFPEKYFYENGIKAGEIIPYINGKRLDNAINNGVIINFMINSYEKVIEDLFLYSNINMKDLCYVNILYSNRNGFHIIDTTEWIFEDNCMKKNKYFFDLSIINILNEYLLIPYCQHGGVLKIDNDFLNNMNKYGHAGIKLADNFILIDENKYDFLSFIFAYLDVYRIHYGEDAKTLKDVKELTKVLKKG